MVVNHIASMVNPESLRLMIEEWIEYLEQRIVESPNKIDDHLLIVCSLFRELLYLDDKS
jgi:hypothetical protein